MSITVNRMRIIYKIQMLSVKVCLISQIFVDTRRMVESCCFCRFLQFSPRNLYFNPVWITTFFQSWNKFFQCWECLFFWSIVYNTINQMRIVYKILRQSLPDLANICWYHACGGKLLPLSFSQSSSRNLYFNSVRIIDFFFKAKTNFFSVRNVPFFG